MVNQISRLASGNRQGDADRGTQRTGWQGRPSSVAEKASGIGNAGLRKQTSGGVGISSLRAVETRKDGQLHKDLRRDEGSWPVTTTGAGIAVCR